MKYWRSILIALAPTYLIRLSIGPIPTTLFELLIYASVIAALIGKRFTIHDSRFTSLWRWGIGLTLLGMLIGIGLSQDRHVALGEAKAFIVDPLLVALLIFGTASAEEIPGLLTGYLMSATVVSLISLAGWWLHVVWAVAADGRLLGLYGLEANASPNYLAFFTGPAVALGIAWIGTAFVNRKPETGNRLIEPARGSWLTAPWLITGATVINLAALIGTQSRAGIAGAIVAGVIALITYYRSTLVEYRFAQGIGWLLLIGLILFGAAVVQPDFGQNVATGGRISSSNNIRWEIWGTTGRLLTVSPKAFIGGLGLGDYQQQFGALTAHQVNYPEFITPRALTPHSLWLNAWVDMGLPGLVGITLLLALALCSLWRAEPTHKATLVAAVLLTIILQGLVDTPAWKNDTSALLWVTLACAALLDRPMNEQT